MKNILTSLAVAALVIAALPSCKKVSPRKLDGKWKVTKGTTNETSEDPNSRSTTKLTFDGAKETGTKVTTYTSGGNSVTDNIDRQVTMTYEFSKDDDSFTIVSTETGTDTDLDMGGYFSKDANGNYIPFSGQVDVKTSYTTTRTTKGIFSITGGAGDVKKNSQIVMQFTSEDDNTSSTIKYFSGTSEITTPLYTAEFTNGVFTYKAAPTTSNTTSTSTGDSAEGLVITVDELKGGVMDISYKDNSTYTSGTYSSKYTGEYTYTLEQE